MIKTVLYFSLITYYFGNAIIYEYYCENRNSKYRYGLCSKLIISNYITWIIRPNYKNENFINKKNFFRKSLTKVKILLQLNILSIKNIE